MTPAHLLLMFQAETWKLMSRPSARIGLVVAALVGVVMPLIMAFLGGTEGTVNGATLADAIEPSGPRAALWALWVRNLWLMQAFVLLLVANSVAGELQARTLREDLLRPVHRSAVIAAKMGAVMVFVGLSLLAQLIPAAGLGTLLLGADGPWKEVLLGYLASALADLSFAAVAFAVAMVVRSLSGTLMGVLLFIVFEKLLSWFLYVAGGILRGLPPEWNQLPPGTLWILDHVPPWLPSSAWEVGSTLADGGEVPMVTWAALALLLAAGWLIADRVFARLEVP